MTLALSNDEFDFISTLLKQRSGLALTPDKGYLIDTRLGPIAKANGMADVRELIARLRSNPSAPLVHQVVESMTTNESMFFRDAKPFDQLAKVILPDLKAKGRNSIRIWSAACSTGQEAYSIAMTLKEEAAKYPGFSAEIYATDLADKVVDRAKAGMYSQFEIQRGLPISLLMKYFTQRPNNNWEINDAIKSMVKFTTGNLLAPYAAVGRFDIIFCRNVLIYFDEKTKADVLDRMAAILNVPGYLFLGGSETTNGLTTKYKTIENHRGLFSLA
ncbi:MAG: protein-glutamate O-methyltransferase CheR [Alphaproteobacteria bacterium]|nr:protein-glutamate O-methyltransferase CheR [Alphaproteobacteria bacterium]